MWCCIIMPGIWGPIWIIVSNLDLNFTSNINDDHKHRHARDLIICIWIWFAMYGSSILKPSRIWLVYSNFQFVFNLGDSELNDRKHMGVHESICKVTKIFRTDHDSILYSVLSIASQGNTLATISICSTWPVCSVLLGRVFTCLHRLPQIIRRWVLRP